MKINFQVERGKKQHWSTLAVQILKDFVEIWKSMSSKQEWRTVLWVHDHNSVCAAHLFIKQGLWIPSPLHFLPPRFSQCDLFKTWLSSSHHTVGTFNGFPELLLGCLWLHLMLWGSFATPLHFYPQDTVSVLPPRTDKIETEIEFGTVRIISGSSGSVISLPLTFLCH